MSSVEWPTALDIVIPVYNEGGNILRTLQALGRDLKTPSRVLICYDREDDDTLPAIEQQPRQAEDASGSNSCATRDAARIPRS